MSEACEFGSLDEANEILGLMMRHWNTIASTLVQGRGLRAAPATGRERRGARQRLGAGLHAGHAHAARWMG